MTLSRLVPFICFLALFHCGSGTPDFTGLKKPSAIVLSSEQIFWQGNTTQFAYVVDEFTQAVTPIDTVREELVDTAEEDEFDFTPIPVGGEPVAIAVDDSTDHHRIFVADQLNNQILAYQMDEVLDTSDFITYTNVPLGVTDEGRSSRPMFKNEGSDSDPTLTNVVVDPTKAKNESWRVVHIGDNQYQVMGTESGVQENVAVEGQAYTSDGGEISFFIDGGPKETSDDDAFFFGTVVTKPLQLTSSPIDLITVSGKMYILTKNVPSILVFDMESLEVINTILFPDPSEVPTRMALLGSDIYVSTSTSGLIYHLDRALLALTSFDTGLPEGFRSVGANGDRLFLVQSVASKVSVWNLVSAGIETTFSFSDAGNDFTFWENGTTLVGLMPNVSGNLDVIDVSGLKRLDTDLSEKTVFVSPNFFDIAPESTPQLISVNTVDGETLTESWQLTFEGIVPGLVDIDGTISGSQVTAGSGVDLGVAGARAGDWFVVPNADAEYEIKSIDGATTLTLVSTPSFSGNVSFEIRANNSYVAVGSISGVQENRVFADETYTSDDAQISLQIRSSFDKPASRGDFFSFETVDTIDPVYISDQAMAVRALSFDRLSDGKPVTYVLEQESGQISIVDLSDYAVQNTL